MKNKITKFSRKDIDAFAVRMSNHTDEEGKLIAMKERLRKYIGEGASITGTAFVIEVYNAPEIREKLDYRLLAVKYMKKSGVKDAARVMQKLEEEAAENVIDYGTPQLKCKANPDYSPD